MAIKICNDKTTTKLERMKVKAIMGIWATGDDTQPGDTFTIKNSNMFMFHTARIWFQGHRRNDKTRRFTVKVILDGDGRERILITRVE